jgi:hypothetical protein
VKKKIMKYTAEQMQVAINEWQISGLSKKTFCRERNITYQTFHYWCKRILKAPSSGFAEVLLPPVERTGGCEIVLPSGARMIFEGEPTASWLREVLK